MSCNGPSRRWADRVRLDMAHRLSVRKASFGFGQHWTIPCRTHPSWNQSWPNLGRYRPSLGQTFRSFNFGPNSITDDPVRPHVVQNGPKLNPVSARFGGRFVSCYAELEANWGRADQIGPLNWTDLRPRSDSKFQGRKYPPKTQTCASHKHMDVVVTHHLERPPLEGALQP